MTREESKNKKEEGSGSEEPSSADVEIKGKECKGEGEIDEIEMSGVEVEK